MGHGHQDRGAAGQLDEDTMRRAVVAEIQPLHLARLERSPHEQAVAVLGPAGPAAKGLVARFAGRTNQTILLERVDALLEARSGPAGGRTCRQAAAQPLRPTVGEVPDVERRDVQAFHSRRIAHDVDALPAG